MAVSFIRTAESHTGTTGSVSQASYTFQPGVAGDTPKGIVVFTMAGLQATDVATAVTYGGSTLNKITGGFASDATTELGCVTAWFLGTSVPTGAPTGGVVVTRTNNTSISYAVAFLLGGAADLKNACTPATQGTTNAAIAPQSIAAGTATSIVLAAAFSGDNTPAPVGNADMTVAHTLLGTYAYSFGSARETTPTTGTRTRGCTQATADDIAHVIVAITENANTISSSATITGALASSVAIYPAVTYTSSLTGLSASTGYHVRAYATNAGGTSYGSEVDFTSGAAATPTTMTSAATITGALASSASITNTPPAILVTTAATITGALASGASFTNTPPARTVASDAALTGPVSSSATIVNTPPSITVSTSATLTGPLASSASVVVPIPVTLSTAATLTGPLASGATIVNTPPAVTLTSTATITGSVASAATLVNTPPPRTISSSVTLTGSRSSSATIVNTPPAVTVVTAVALTGALASSAALVNTPPARTITTAATLTGALASSASLVSVASANTMSSSITLTGPLVSSADLVNTPPPITVSSTATVTGAVSSAAAVSVVQPPITIVASATLTGALNSSAAVGTGDIYTSSLTGLTGNTTYHVRAYATNSAGTSYGNEVDFLTETPPAVTMSASATLTGSLSSGVSLLQGVIVINANLAITSDKPHSIEVEGTNATLTGSLSCSATISHELLTFPATISATGAAAGCAMNAIQCRMVLVQPSSDIHVKELDTFPVEITLSPAVPTGYLLTLGATDDYNNLNLSGGVTDGIRTSWIQNSYAMNYTPGHQPPGYYYRTYFHLIKWPEYSYYLVPPTTTGLTLTIYESTVTATIGATGAAAGCNMEVYNTTERECVISAGAAAASSDMYITQNKLTAEFSDLPDGSVYQVGAPMHLVIDLSAVPGRGNPDTDGNYGSEGWEEQLLFWIWVPATWNWRSADPFYYKIPPGVTHYETDIYPRQDWDKVPYAFTHGDTVTWVVSHVYDSQRELYGNYVELETTYTDVDAPIAAAAAAPSVRIQSYNYGAEIDARAGSARVTATSETEFEHSMTIGCSAAKAGVQITANKIRHRRKQVEVERSGANRADVQREDVSPRGGIIASVTTNRAVQKKGAVDGFDNN